jgi:hypothetical protein
VNPTRISAASGMAWGLVGFWLIRDTNMAGGAWAALVASPIIGVGVGSLAMRARRLDPLGWVLVGLVDLYLAVALFAAAVGIWHVTVEWGVLPHLESAGRWSAFAASVATALWGFTLTGSALLLWPVSVANHLLLWALASEAETGAA